MSSGEISNSRLMSGVRELVGAEILVIDRDEAVTKGVTQLLSAASLHVTAVSDVAAGLDQLDKRFFSVIVVDIDTPEPNAGLETIRALRERTPTSMLIALTPRKSYTDAVAAIRAGAMDVILKSPDSVGYLKDRVLEAAGRSVDKREVNSVLHDVRESHEEFLQRFMEAERRALDLSDRLAGRDPKKVQSGEAVRVLIVDAAGTLAQQLLEAKPEGFEFSSSPTGGQALDLVTSSRFQIVMVASDLPDLPGSMVVRSIKTQNPEVVAIQFTPPPGGSVEIVESTKTIPVVAQFDDPKQLLDRLDELAEAFRARARERRYTQAFRERHYDFLRRYVELKSKIDRALTGG
jgi:DNA-binding response OmpR family regulator